MAKIFTISGPTAVGKDYIAQQVLDKHPSWKKLITFTSRKMFGKNEASYKFLSEEEFKKKIEHDKMFEWAKVHDDYYGITKEQIEKLIDQDQPVIGDVNVDGAGDYKKKLGDKVVTIFMKPAKFSDLEKRIKRRDRGESEEVVSKRLKTAKQELKQQDSFDYVITNIEGKPEVAEKELKEIVERLAG